MHNAHETQTQQLIEMTHDLEEQCTRLNTHWIPDHTGNTWNEEADTLAKQGTLLGQTKNHRLIGLTLVPSLWRSSLTGTHCINDSNDDDNNKPSITNTSRIYA